MMGKRIELLFSCVGVVLNLLSLFLSTPKDNKTPLVLSMVAVIFFILVMALEYFRNRDIELIKQEAQPLDDTDLVLKTAFPNGDIVSDRKKIEWQQAQQQRIHDKIAMCLKWQKVFFWFGISFSTAFVFSLIIAKPS